MAVKEVLLQWLPSVLIKSFLEVLLQLHGQRPYLQDKSVIKSEILPKQQLTEELHNPITRKFEKREVYLSFKHNILWVDQADMQLTSSNKQEWTPLKYLNFLHYNRTQNQLPHKNLYDKVLEIFVTLIPPNKTMSVLKII